MSLLGASLRRRARARAHAEARAPFEVEVRTVGGRVCRIVGCRSMLVLTFIHLVAEALEHEWSRLVLLGDVRLEEGRALSGYNIQQGSVLTCVLWPRLLAVNVRYGTSGLADVFDVEPGGTIDDVMAQIAARHVGFPSDSQRLTLMPPGELIELAGGRNVSDYNIATGTDIVLWSRDLPELTNMILASRARGQCDWVAGRWVRFPRH